MNFRSARRARVGALLLACALAISPRALRAQSDPTPFWISEPPVKDTPPPPKKRSKPAKPDRQRAAPSAFQDDDDQPPPPKRKAAPKPVPAKKKKPAADDEDAEPVAPKPKPRYEPLPPLPHLEPTLPPQAAPAYPPPAQPPDYPQPDQAPAAPTPAPAPQAAPRATYPPPYALPPYAPPAAPPAQPRDAPAPRQDVVVPIDERGTASDPSSDAYKQAHPLPPMPSQPMQPEPRQQPPLRPDLRSYSQPPPSPEPEPIDESQPPRLRRFSLEALGGVWSKATSDGQTRDWQIAYGADLGFAVTRWLAIDARAVRSSGTDGTTYVNATTSHLLVDGRLTGVVNFRDGKLAVFAGGGGGFVLENTQLFLQDVGAPPTTLSSSGLEGIAEAVVGARLRPWKGITVRLEVDGLIRQGAFEPLFLLGVGWAF